MRRKGHLACRSHMKAGQVINWAWRALKVEFPSHALPSPQATPTTPPPSPKAHFKSTSTIRHTTTFNVSFWHCRGWQTLSVPHSNSLGNLLGSRFNMHVNLMGFLVRREERGEALMFTKLGSQSSVAQNHSINEGWGNNGSCYCFRHMHVNMFHSHACRCAWKTILPVRCPHFR